MSLLSVAPSCHRVHMIELLGLRVGTEIKECNHQQSQKLQECEVHSIHEWPLGTKTNGDGSLHFFRCVLLFCDSKLPAPALCFECLLYTYLCNRGRLMYSRVSFLTPGLQ